MRETDYCVDIKTLCLASLGFCPAPVELQTRFAMRQFEHGDSLSHRIWQGVSSVPLHIRADCMLCPARPGSGPRPKGVRGRAGRCTSSAAWWWCTYFPYPALVTL